MRSLTGAGATGTFSTVAEYNSATTYNVGQIVSCVSTCSTNGSSYYLDTSTSAGTDPSTNNGTGQPWLQVAAQGANGATGATGPAGTVSPNGIAYLATFTNPGTGAGTTYYLDPNATGLSTSHTVISSSTQANFVTAPTNCMVLH